MAARSRPRAGQLNQELDEEKSIWSQIRADAKRVDQLMLFQNITQSAQQDATEEVAKGEEDLMMEIWNEIRASAKKVDKMMNQSNTISKRIVELEQQQTARKARGESPSTSIDAELEKNLRENIRLSEEMQNLISSDSGDNDILNKLEILGALRNAHEDPISSSRATSVGKSQRDRQNKRKLTDAMDDRDSIAADSPGAQSSPKVVVPNPKLKNLGGVSRAGSVGAGRESSVKVEDMQDGSDHLKVLPEKHRLSVNTEVLYRNKSRSLEGEGILCRVTSVIGEGKQRRYEIIDSDPDPPTPAQPYRASVNHLAAIPPLSSNKTLPDMKVGKPVLALYPGTTTFYKAEVVSAWSGKKEVKEEGKDEAENLVRLRFEGEDEADREMSVERRYVLPEK